MNPPSKGIFEDEGSLMKVLDFEHRPEQSEMARRW